MRMLKVFTFGLIIACFASLSSGGLATVIGLDFFPTADVGLIKLHYRAPPGTRLERTEELVLQVEDSIRKLIPAEELDTALSVLRSLSAKIRTQSKKQSRKR